ncbi:FCGR1 protein, partial [Amia calva]|nr:FCGR1 protein [Amia calva]
QPGTVLSLQPLHGEILEGDRVTLSCVVEDMGIHSSAWLYYWYKDSLDNTVHQSSNSSRSGATYTISSAALTHTGRYWCRAGRGEPPFNLNHTRAVRIQVSELFLGVHITAQPSETVWEGETLTLHCAAQLKNSAHKLQYRYVREGRVVKSSWEDTYTIKVRQGDGGKYHCEAEAAGKGIYSTSNDVEITVTDHKVILQTPPLPLTEGDNVTLVCRDKSTSSSFYKDNKKLLSDTTQNILRISPVRKDAEGMYRCQHSLDSEEVQISVRGKPLRKNYGILSEWYIVYMS